MTRRWWIGLVAVGMLLGGCGGDDGGGDGGGSVDVGAVEAQLIENGISEDLAGCIADALGEAGISADQIADIQSADALTTATQDCAAEAIDSGS